jgi:hypothetical protein
MGCGCLLALFAAISPRLAIFAGWLFTDRLSQCFSSFWIGFAGFLFLPWTTLAYAVAYSPLAVHHVSGFGILLVIFAFLVDLSTHFGAGKARAERANA